MTPPPIILTAKPKQRLGRALVLLKNSFWPSYCQILTDLDKILYTPILLHGVHLWTDFDRDRRVGGSRANQNDCVFVILVTHPKVPKSYRDNGSTRFRRQTVRVKVRTDVIVKNSGIL